MLPIGFCDKLYWRRCPDGQFHCFKRATDVYITLCDKYTSPRSGGQQCDRPEAILRCPQCDVAEMKRRGKEESLPASPKRKAE